MKKLLVVGVIILFIGLAFAPSVISKIVDTGDVIIVDDEGDGDFTSIKEAVNYSSPGDTIEVYSGTYPEDGILLTKENVNLLGIDHELGEGNDSGKPFIKPDGNATVIVVNASHVIVSNFRIEKLSSSFCIHLGSDKPNLNQNNNTISDCIIRNPYGYGIKVYRIGRNINVINNQITNCNTVGIDAFSSHVNIKGNVITDCVHAGISILGAMENISYNTIKRCGTGIRIYGSNNIIYGNEFEACSTGISNENGGSNRIIKNNFKEYWYFKPWFLLSFWDLGTKDRYIGNYWDTWKGVGPKRIPGILILGIPFTYILIPIPWFAFDWHPAQEPYDLGGMI